MVDIKAPETIDFDSEGLMVGLEFHQQIFAPYDESPLSKKHGSKLFCSCPALLRDDEPDFNVLRRFRAVSGETGDIDISAEFEKTKQNDTLYEAYHDTTCLIELDEEPIYPINSEALYRALAISKNIFKLNLVDEILVSRKTIIDGSNTSGFQRTSQIGYKSTDSKIDVNGLEVSIYQANLEEDSAKNTGRKGTTRKFQLDRLGIPLIEIATGPDMKHPDEVLATAARIGELLRTTGFVKRGQGTIRQDLNVSIKRGTRVEIKGVSELDLLPEFVKNEAIRQKRMLELLELFQKRGLSKRKISYIKPKDVSKLFKKTKAKRIAKTIKSGSRVTAAKLPGLQGLIGYELQPDYRFGTELAQVCKVAAGVGGIFHSDELPKYGISQEEVDAVRSELKLKKDDAFFLVAAPQTQGHRAVEGVKSAFKMWLSADGLIPEVRAPRDNGTTGYLRPLPGKARMYPETDARPIPLDKSLLERIENTEFEMPEERVARYKNEYKLSKDLADQLAIHPQNILFEEIVNSSKADPTLVASTLLSTLVNLRRDGKDIDKISDERLLELFSLVHTGEISKDAVEQVLIGIADEDLPPSKLVSILGLEKASSEEIEAVVVKIVATEAEFIAERGMAAMGKIMQLSMKELAGKADGKLVSQIVRKAIQSHSS